MGATGGTTLFTPKMGGGLEDGQKPPCGIYSAKTLWWKILPGAYLRGANDFGWHQKYFDCLPNMNNVMREACKNLNQRT